MLFKLLKCKKNFVDESGNNVEFYQLFLINEDLALKIPICSAWSKNGEKTKQMYNADMRLLKSLAYEDIKENI